MKRILVTGAAGFIGFHLSLCLKNRGDFVIGYDNFNAYYDVSLKNDRAKILEENDITIINGDICNKDQLYNLIKTHNITHIVHLAAQAGVRYSITHPETYISSNLKGFVSLLETCRHFPKIKVTYASSSSVYGLNTKIPFCTEDPTDQPANLYGATKKANELMAHAYHHLYKIPLTGLRFFTVYGPYGRPDMAYFSFTKKILNNEPISIFNHGKMKRDFTYIDDIVQGIVAAVDLGADFEIFNLGNNKPEELMDMIFELEKLLGKTAIKEMLPLQKGEALTTYADISKAQKLLHFSPKTSLKQGLFHFVNWYKKYYKL